MIRIADITLSCLDEYNPTREQLRELFGLLSGIGSDYVELSVRAYHKIGELPAQGNYILRCDSLAEAQKYPFFNKYVCRRTGRPAPANVISEIQVNDIREINFFSQYFSLNNIRVRGLDDLIAHDYRFAFDSLRKTVKGNVQLCPENKYGCATAIAVEWVLSGGGEVAASFAGFGGFAPLEELLMALRLEIRHRPSLDFSNFPRVRSLLETITGREIPKNKPVIGQDIFHMEAGIHADGISKDPRTYEPFSPELVGNKRRLILGKHSGKNAVLIKLKELGLDPNAIDILSLPKMVRNESIKKQESLTDEEFIRLYWENAK